MMNWTKLSPLAPLMAALINLSATAYADCGDAGHDPCTGPVPTVEQVVGIMQRLTDPNIPAANKSDIVTPGLAPDEAGTIDDHLRRTDAAGLLPYNFVVTDIVPAPANFAGVTCHGGKSRQSRYPTNRAIRPGRALADHPRLRHDRDVLVLAGRSTQGWCCSLAKHRQSRNGFSVWLVVGRCRCHEIAQRVLKRVECQEL